VLRCALFFGSEIFASCFVWFKGVYIFHKVLRKCLIVAVVSECLFVLIVSDCEDPACLTHVASL